MKGKPTRLGHKTARAQPVRKHARAVRTWHSDSTRESHPSYYRPPIRRRLQRVISSLTTSCFPTAAQKQIWYCYYIFPDTFYFRNFVFCDVYVYFQTHEYQIIKI